MSHLTKSVPNLTHRLQDDASSAWLLLPPEGGIWRGDIGATEERGTEYLIQPKLNLPRPRALKSREAQMKPTAATLSPVFPNGIHWADHGSNEQLFARLHVHQIMFLERYSSAVFSFFLKKLTSCKLIS